MRLSKRGFDDAYGGCSGDDSNETEPGFVEERTVLWLSPLLASRSHQHHHVEHLPRVGSVAGWKHHLDDQ